MENIIAIFFILVNQANATPNVCLDYQLAVKFPDSNITCVKCPVCPPGSGAAVLCGSVVPYNASIDCVPCIQGEFSDSFSPDKCKPCLKCKSNEVMGARCTNISNTRCSCKACPEGHYRNQTTSECLPCSECCGSDLAVGQCVTQGMPRPQTCGYRKKSQCVSKCWYDEVTVVMRGGEKRCSPCPACSKGFGLTAPCGGTTHEETPITCQRPLLGKTFVNPQGVLQQCSVCSPEREVLKNCSFHSDIICGNCMHDFYFDVSSQSCQECFWCCGHYDARDIKKCIREGMLFAKQGPFFPFVFQNSLNVIATPQEYEPAKQLEDQLYLGSWRHEKNLVMLALAVILFVVVICLWFVFNVRKCPFRLNSVGKLEEITLGQMPQYTACNPDIKETTHCQDVTPAIATFKETELERPELLSPGVAVFKKTGVEVLTLDEEEHAANDLSQHLSLQASCNDGSQPSLLEDGEVLLSSIMNFVPSTKLKGAVEVEIPHGANVILSPKEWFIMLKELHNNRWVNASHPAADGSENLRVNTFTVESNHVKFQTSHLSTFAVVGKYDGSSSTVLKRMKTAAFCNEPRAGKPLHVRVYCFDDCEWAYERLMKEEEMRGGKLVSSLESFDFSVSTDEDVEINVQSVDCWKLDQSSPNKLSHKLLRDSFSTVSSPCCDLLFHPNSPTDKSFFATIVATQSSRQAMMYAGIAVKEDPAKSVNLKMKVNIPNESLAMFGKGSLELFSLSEKALREVALTLDMLPKGVGNWRHLGRALGVSKEELEEFGREYLDPDGSPASLLLRRISQSHPSLTIANAVGILHEIKREDVIECITSGLEKAKQQTIVHV